MSTSVGDITVSRRWQRGQRWTALSISPTRLLTLERAVDHQRSTEFDTSLADLAREQFLCLAQAIFDGLVVDEQALCCEYLALARRQVRGQCLAQTHRRPVLAREWT